MNKAHACCLLLLLPTACAVPSAKIQSSELQTHVRWLASDAQEGRRTGSAGAYRAGDYLARQLQAAGLEPGGENGSWFQEFEVTMPAQPGTNHLRVDGEAWSDVGTVAASPTEEVEGELVPVAYGVVSAADKMDDYAQRQVEGKVVLLRRYCALGCDDSEQAKELGNLRKKIRKAAAMGAVGVVLGVHPEDVNRGGAASVRFKDVQGIMPIPVVTVASAAFGALETRCQNSVLPVQVQLAAEVVKEKRIARNVIGKIPGRCAEWIVVGAHYDHLGWGGEGSLAPGVHAIHNGADDNASGTAMTLELAEAWSLRSKKEGAPARGLLFCLWSGEELGLLGSAHWVEQPTVPLGDVVFNLNLDMVGRLQSGSLTVGSAMTAKAFAPALDHAQAALKEAGSALELQVAGSALPGGGGSDHMSFEAVEIPAVFFFSGLHSDYHKPSDDWQKLSFWRMQELSVALMDFLDQTQTAALRDFAYIKPKAPEHGAKSRRGMGDGVWFGSLPDYGAAPERGMKITGTSAGSPAEKAGLQAGDIIIQVGDFEIGDIYDFMDSLAEFHNGQTITITVLRNEQPKELSLTFFPRP